jgi:hypothetical protein
MEPAGPLPHSQASATCPYPGPAQSSPHTHIPPPGDKTKPIKNKNVHDSCTYYRVMIFSNLVCKTPETFIYYICTRARHMHCQHKLHTVVLRSQHRSRMTDQSRTICPGIHWSRIVSSSTIGSAFGRFVRRTDGAFIKPKNGNAF